MVIEQKRGHIIKFVPAKRKWQSSPSTLPRLDTPFTYAAEPAQQVLSRVGVVSVMNKFFVLSDRTAPLAEACSLLAT
jgi:hypothetical protein